MDTARKSPGFLHLLPLKGGGEWLHMCIRHKETSTYLMDEVALDDLIVDALMEEDTRSRLRVRDEGIMVLLKAMHLRGEDMARPEDMISMRLWLTPDRVISTREADVDPILEIAARLAKGEGPVTSGDFLGDLVEEHLDEVEAQVEMIEDDTAQIAQLIGNHRLRPIRLRPQGRAGDRQPPHHDLREIDLGLGAGQKGDHHQPPVQIQRLEVLGDIIAPDHIEDQVRATRILQDLHIILSPVVDRVRAQLGDGGAFLVRSGGGPDPRADGAGDLDRHGADA